MFFDVIPIFVLLVPGLVTAGDVLTECRAWEWKNISAVLYRTAFSLGLVQTVLFAGTTGLGWWIWWWSTAEVLVIEGQQHQQAQQQQAQQQAEDDRIVVVMENGERVCVEKIHS